MNEIEVIPDREKLSELLAERNPLGLVDQLEGWITKESLTSGRFAVTATAADIPGIGLVTDLQLLYTGKFTQGGDQFVVTNLGIVNISKMCRVVRAAIHEATDRGNSGGAE